MNVTSQQTAPTVSPTVNKWITLPAIAGVLIGVVVGYAFGRSDCEQRAAESTAAIEATYNREVLAAHENCRESLGESNKEFNESIKLWREIAAARKKESDECWNQAENGLIAHAKANVVARETLDGLGRSNDGWEKCQRQLAELLAR